MTAEQPNVPPASGARGALVQQIAEAAMQAMGCREYEGPQDGEHYCAEHQHLWLDNRGCQDALVAARAVLPLVEAQVAPLRDEVAGLRGARNAARRRADTAEAEVERLKRVNLDGLSDLEEAIAGTNAAESALRQVREDLTALASLMQPAVIVSVSEMPVVYERVREGLVDLLPAHLTAVPETRKDQS